MEINLKERREHKEGVRQNHDRTESWGQDYSSQDFMILSRHDSAALVPPYRKRIQPQRGGMFIVTKPQKRSSSVGATWNCTCRPAGAWSYWEGVFYKHSAPTELTRRLPSSLPRDFFQRLRIGSFEYVSCRLPYAKIRVGQQFHQLRSHRFSFIPQNHQHIFRGIPDILRPSEPFNHHRSYESRFDLEIDKCQRGRQHDASLVVSEALHQNRYRRKGIRSHRLNVDSSPNARASWLLIREDSQKTGETTKSSESASCSVCGHCFGTVHNSNEFWDSSLCCRTQCAKSRDRALGTKLLPVGDLPIGRELFQSRIDEVVKFGFPRRCLIPDPPQQMGNNYVRSQSHLLDRNSEWVRLAAYPYVYVGTMGSSLHPLTQPLPPILRIGRGTKNQRNRTNQHPNPNQNQEEASPLLHGVTIMRSHAAEASRKPQQQGKNFSQKQTKVTKREAHFQIPSFPSFPSVKEYFFALPLFTSCSAIRAIRVIRGSISLRALRYLLFKSDSRPFAFIRGSHNPIFRLPSPNS